jgi:hypothetical protein
VLKHVEGWSLVLPGDVGTARDLGTGAEDAGAPGS